MLLILKCLPGISCCNGRNRSLMRKEARARTDRLSARFFLVNKTA